MDITGFIVLKVFHEIIECVQTSTTHCNYGTSRTLIDQSFGWPFTSFHTFWHAAFAFFPFFAANYHHMACFMLNATAMYYAISNCYVSCQRQQPYFKPCDTLHGLQFYECGGFDI